jgi:hypothetical protein
VKLSALFSFLPGCAPKPPKGPGTSVPLQYPVLLLGQHRVVVKPDEFKLTSTNIASGLNFEEFTLIDAAGRQFSIPRVTEFGKTSGLFDMGTARFHVYLHLKSAGQPSLADLKSLVKQMIRPDSVKDPAAAARKIDAATSPAHLIEICSRAWSW